MTATHPRRRSDNRPAPARRRRTAYGAGLLVILAVLYAARRREAGRKLGDRVLDLLGLDGQSALWTLKEPTVLGTRRGHTACGKSIWNS
jgi:hypothetical protein